MQKSFRSANQIINCCISFVNFQIGLLESLLAILQSNLNFIKEDKPISSLKKERKEFAKIQTNIKIASEIALKNNQMFINTINEYEFASSPRGRNKKLKEIETSNKNINCGSLKIREKSITQAYVSLINHVQTDFPSTITSKYANVDFKTLVLCANIKNESGDHIKDLIEMFPDWYRMNLILTRKDQLNEELERLIADLNEIKILDDEEEIFSLEKEDFEFINSFLLVDGKVNKLGKDSSNNQVKNKSWQSFLDSLNEIAIEIDIENISSLKDEIENISALSVVSGDSLIRYIDLLEECVERNLSDILIPLLNSQVKMSLGESEDVDNRALKLFRMTHSILCKQSKSLCSFTKI